MTRWIFTANLVLLSRQKSGILVGQIGNATHACGKELKKGSSAGNLSRSAGHRHLALFSDNEKSRTDGKNQGSEPFGLINIFSE